MDQYLWTLETGSEAIPELELCLAIDRKTIDMVIMI